MSYVPDYPFGGGSPSGDIEDLEEPFFLSWTTEEVGNFIKNSGYPQYRDCFESNFISGRQLIRIDAATLPKIGITDFEHIKAINIVTDVAKEMAKNIRDLIEVEPTRWERSIADPPREKLALFLEKKSGTGKKSEALSFREFSDKFDGMKFQPPLENRGLINASCVREDCGNVLYIKQL